MEIFLCYLIKANLLTFLLNDYAAERRGIYPKGLNRDSFTGTSIMPAKPSLFILHNCSGYFW